MGDSENRLRQWFQNSPYQQGRSSNPNPQGGHAGGVNQGDLNKFASSPSYGFSRFSSSPGPRMFQRFSPLPSSGPVQQFSPSPSPRPFQQFSTPPEHQRFRSINLNDDDVEDEEEDENEGEEEEAGGSYTSNSSASISANEGNSGQIRSQLHESNNLREFKMVYEIYTRKVSDMEPQQLENHRKVCAMLERKWNFGF